MNCPRLRRFVLCFLVIVAFNAFAQTPPPTTPFEVINWKATQKHRPSTGLKMGTLPVQFEKTTLDNVRRAADAGEIAHRGDAGDSMYWLCYTNLAGSQIERIWVIADGEMGGPEHFVTAIRAALVPGGSATADCPALPDKLKPVSLENQLWLGASKAGAINKLGAPSFQKGAWRSYDFRGKVPGNCQGGAFDVSASLLLHFQDGDVDSLQVGQITSC